MNKGGRPRKIDSAILKKIALDFYIREKEGDNECLKKKGIYASLSEYANKQGYSCVATDFSRCKVLRDWLEVQVELAVKNAETENISQTGYVPMDLDYLFRPDLTAEKQKKYLLERDAYFQSVHNKAAKAIEAYVQLQQQNDELRKRLLHESKSRESQEEVTSELIREDRALKKENAYYRRYIKEHVEPQLAEIMLVGEGTTVAFSNKEPALITMSEFKRQDVAAQSDGELLSKIGAIAYGKTQYKD